MNEYLIKAAYGFISFNICMCFAACKTTIPNTSDNDSGADNTVNTASGSYGDSSKLGNELFSSLKSTASSSDNSNDPAQSVNSDLNGSEPEKSKDERERLHDAFVSVSGKDYEIYFVNSDSQVTVISDKSYGGFLAVYEGENVLKAGSSKFVVLIENCYGSGSSAHIFGVKSGSLYEPSVSGAYDDIQPDRDEFILSKSSSVGGRHFDEYRFTFDSSSGEFVESSSSGGETPQGSTGTKTPTYAGQNALELIHMSLSQIVELMGGSFQSEPKSIGDSSTSSCVICNPGTLPGYMFVVKNFTYDDFESDITEHARLISEGYYDLECIYFSGTYTLNGVIRSDMRYNELTAYYGDFDCMTAGGQGEVKRGAKLQQARLIGARDDVNKRRGALAPADVGGGFKPTTDGRMSPA